LFSFIRAIGDYSLVLFFSVAWDLNKWYQSFSGSTGSFIRVKQIALETYTISIGDKDLIFPIWICFH